MLRARRRSRRSRRSGATGPRTLVAVVAALVVDDREERVVGLRDHLAAEGPGEHDDPGPVGEGADHLGLQGPPIAGHGFCGVHEDIAAYLGRMRVVGRVGLLLDTCAELVEVAVRLAEPCGWVQGGGHVV